MSKKYKIQVDVTENGAKKTENALKGVDKAAKDLTNKQTLKGAVDSAKADFGSFDAVLGKVAGSINLPFVAGAAAVGAFTVAVGAAVAGTKVLLDLTKGAAAFGGEIEEAMNKTGLGAEVLSALKFRADQAGQSLNVVTDATAKFARTVGQAAEGSEQAVAMLAKFGVTPVEAMNDLEGSLEKVFKRIVEAKDGTEQMALAQQAFGRSGANLIDFLKSFDGDLKKVTAEARRLGLVIGDEAALAAAEFEDQLFTLGKQAEMVGHQIGFQVMPTITQGIASLSEYMAKNQGVAAEWGKTLVDVAYGVNYGFDAMQQVIETVTFGMIKAESAANALGTRLRWLRSILDWGDLLGAIAEVGRLAGSREEDDITSGPSSFRFPVGGGSDFKMPARSGKGGGKNNAAEQARREAERQARVDLQAQLSIEQILHKTLEDQFKQRMDWQREYLAGTADIVGFEQGSAEAIRLFDHNITASIKSIEAFEKELLGANASVHQQAELQAKQAARRDNLQKLAAEQIKVNLQSVMKLEKEQFEYKLKALENEYQHRDRLLEQQQKEIDLAAKRRQQLLDEVSGLIGGPNGSGTIPVMDSMREMFGAAIGAISSTMTGEDGLERMKTEAEFMKDTFADMSSSIVGSLSNITQGLAQMVSAWISGAEFSAQAALQMVSGVATALAMEALMKGIFQTAEAAAAYATLNIPKGNAHTAAAAFYYKTAAIAGAIGVGAGLGARAAGGGSGDSSGRAAQRNHEDYVTSDPRRAEDAMDRTSGGSGHPFARAIRELVAEVRESRDANKRIADRIDSMPAGEVLRLGAKQNPGFIAGQTIRGLRTNSKETGRMQRSLKMS